MDSFIEIEGRRIGPGHPVYIVAEMSANHAGSFATAVEILHAAKKAGADAIKVQTYTPDTMTLASSAAPFRIQNGSPWDGRLLYDLYREASMPWEWQPKLKEIASEIGLHFFSTPFDATAVDFLERMGVPAYKIASFEIVDIPLVECVAKTGRPLILSTGMATSAEIEDAIRAARDAGAGQILLLKCTSAYPALVDQMHLRTIPEMARRFAVPVGLSDHSLGNVVPIAAIALGACLVEKHFLLDKRIATPDSGFSLDPGEFGDMVRNIRTVEKALGDVRFGEQESERSSRVFRRSLFVVRRVRRGEPFTTVNVRSIRPGSGLPPKHLREILGRFAAADIDEGTPLSWDLVSGEPHGG